MTDRPVKAILKGGDVLSAAPDMTVRGAAMAMAERGCGSIVVMEAGRLVGIFTERDILTRVLAVGRDPDATPLGAVMTANPDTIAGDASVCQAVRMMDECGYRHLPVTEAGRLVGILSIRDLPLVELASMAGELDQRQALTERIW